MNRPEMKTRPADTSRDFEYPNKVFRSCVYCCHEVMKPLPHVKNVANIDPRKTNFYAYCNKHGFEPTDDEQLHNYCDDFEWRD